MCLFQKNLNKMKCIIYENTPTGISVKVLLLSMDCCETGFFFLCLLVVLLDMLETHRQERSVVQMMVTFPCFQ